MELAVADISQEISSCNQILSTPTPMEVELETELVQTQEISKTVNGDDLVEKKDEALEPENEKPSAEIEENDEESKETVLKGILKYEHIYGLDKKSVDFDLDIELIPYDKKDYTVDIQIVKELPKKIVSYRELFKKMAEEEKAAKERAAKGESAEEAEDDDDDEIEDSKAFSHLVIKEPPVHHSANDIDVESYKALKAATGQNEKNEDFPNLCHSDVSQKEKENSSRKDPDNSNILENGKFSLEAIDAIIVESSNNNSQLTEIADEISSNTNQILNEFSRALSDPNQLIINKNIENTALNYTLTEEESQNVITHKRKNKNLGNNFETKLTHLNGNLEEIDSDMDVDELLNCGHDYIYSDFSEAEETSEIMDSKLTTNHNDPLSISPCREDNLSIPQIKSQNGPQEHFHENSNETWNSHENVDIVLGVPDVLNDSQDFKSKHLNVDINAIVPNGLLQDKHHKVTLESIKEERSFNSSREDLNVSPNLGPTINTLNNVKVNVNRVIKSETAKREIGVQTEFDFTHPSNGLLCTCCLKPKSNVEEQNMDRFQNTNIPSLNSDDSIAMLASDLDLDCQEDKSATESSEGNFRDFTQSTSLDFSSSLSMESFEMDDTSLRIEMENGCPSYDVNM